MRYRERCSPLHRTVLGATGTLYRGVEIQRLPQYSPYGYGEIDRSWDELHPGPPYLSGGPLKLTHAKDWIEDIKLIGYYTGRFSSTTVYFYDGGFIPVTLAHSNPQNVGLSGSFGPDWGDPSPYGAEAWNRFKPRLEFANMGVAIAEARDIPRMLRNTAKVFRDSWKAIGGKGLSAFMHPKYLANQFLNTQFGWKPFLSDMRDCMNVTTNFHKFYNQVKRDNGNWVRRRGTMISTHPAAIHLSGTTIEHRPQLGVYLYKSVGGPYNHWSSSSNVLTDVWFDGKFRYWIPSFANDTSPLARIKNYLSLYGIGINPSVLWEATPWSWLIDWFSNAGDVISNISSISCSNMVAKYAYVMGHVTDSYTISVTIHLKDGDVSDSWSQDYEIKHRVGANAFGFNLVGAESLSPIQVAILAALGIMRM